MKRYAWLLPALMLTLVLGACDSLKSRVVAFLDEKIEQTGPTAYTGEPIRSLTGKDFDEFAAIKGHVVLIDFHADWCGPCRQLGPVLETLVKDHGGKVLLGKVNVDDCKELSAEHGVRNIPDVRIFVGGKQVDRFVGMPPVPVVHQRIEAQLDKLAEGKGQKAAASPKSKAPAEEVELQPAEAQPTVRPMDEDWMPPGIQRNS